MLLNQIKYNLPLQIFSLLKKAKYSRYKRELLNYYKDCPVGSEVYEAVDFIKKNGLISFYPYQFINNYNHKAIEVFYDDALSLHYVLHQGKRLYFNKGIKKYEVASIYTQLLIEQDRLSPHKYQYEDYLIRSDSEQVVLFDIGAAEGILGLEVINKIEKLVIVECDTNWIDALTATFRPWQNKVVIIQKYINNIDDDDNITIDSLYSKYCNPKNDKAIIKLDVEGMEGIALNNATNTLTENVIWMICTYHKASDYETFSKLFRNFSYNIKSTNGHMVVLAKGYWAPPYLRKGVIIASR